jgi:hypothetical protein
LVCLLITTAVLPSRGFAAQANSITQFGITWTFDANYPCGRFANGDYWVVGPVNIISIEPNSRNVAGVIKNGSMVNPSPTTSISGYDNTSTRFGYNASYNKAFDVNSSNPLILAVDSSLISTISVDGINQRPQIKTAAILTVLASAPASGSFRPPYCGTTKTIKFNKSELDYTKLAKLTPTIGQPRIGQQVGDAQADSVERMFERPWIDHTFGWVGDYAHPADNMPNYGRDMSAQVGIAALILNLDLPDASKETLMIRFVQLGIDLYGIIENGGERNYPGDTGIFQGRKWPILFAGIVLNDANMKAVGNKSGDYLYTGGYGPGNPPPDGIYFGEDDQTFYVSAADVYPVPYTLSAYRHPTTSGTVTCTKGSNTVTGSGTTWKEMLVGFNTYFGALDAEVNDPNGQAYAITSIDSNTTLTLAVPYRGNPNDTNGTVYTGLAYKISDFVYYGHGNIGSYVECEEYLSSDIGLPEWGIKHYIMPLLDGKGWDIPYRNCCSATSFTGWILSAHIMNAKTLWNHNALFDYQDRYMQTEGQYRCFQSSWVCSMWSTYRANYGNVWSPIGSNNSAPVLAAISDKAVNENSLLSFTVTATDADGNAITYSAQNLPTGATFVGQTFSWTPAPNQAGTYHVTFIASDGLLQDSETITIIVYSTDTFAPTVNGLSPAADSLQVPLDRLVILNVADDGGGVDANSVTIKVNGNIVYTGDTADYSSPYGRCHRTGAKADYTFIYQPHAAFDYDQKVSVVVNAHDLAGNAMSQYSYSFVTEARSFGENKMVNSSSKDLSKGHPATVRDSAGNIWVAWHAGQMSGSGMRRGVYVGKLPAGADNFGTSIREANEV